MFYAVAVTTSTGGAIFLSGKAPKGRNRPSGDRRPTGRSAKAFGPPPQGAPRLGPRQKIEGGRRRATAPAPHRGAWWNRRTTAHASPCGGRHLCHAYTQGRGQRHRLYTLAGLRGNLRVRTPTGVPLFGWGWGRPPLRTESQQQRTTSTSKGYAQSDLVTQRG